MKKYNIILEKSKVGCEYAENSESALDIYFQKFPNEHNCTPSKYQEKKL